MTSLVDTVVRFGLGVWALLALLFILCSGLVALVLYHAGKHHVLQNINKTVHKTALGFARMLKENTERRQMEEERLQREQGNREKKNVFYRMDALLLQSGVRKVFPWITVEVFLLLISVLMTAVLCMITGLTGTVILGASAALGSLIVVLAMLRVALFIQRKKVDDEIMQFANLLENYARTSDDIVSIFGKIHYYLAEPLRTAVEQCYHEAKLTGDFAKACARLEVRIGNRHFAGLLANLELCSRHEANYEDVIHGSKEMIRQYLSERAVRREMANAARVQILILLFIGGVICVMLNNLLGGLLLSVLTQNTGGRIILGGLMVLLLYCANKMLTIGQEV